MHAFLNAYTKAKCMGSNAALNNLTYEGGEEPRTKVFCSGSAQSGCSQCSQCSQWSGWKVWSTTSQLYGRETVLLVYSSSSFPKVCAKMCSLGNQPFHFVIKDTGASSWFVTTPQSSGSFCDLFSSDTLRRKSRQ